MKLLIKQRVFSWTDTYDVYDEFGVARYYVKADFFSLGHVIHIYRKDTGEEVGLIRQRILSFLARFDMECQGYVVGTIKKRLTLFKPAYDIDCNGWYVEGDFWGWNYSVRSGGQEILYINKELFNWGDTYALHITDPANEIAALMLVLAIDAANCSK